MPSEYHVMPGPDPGIHEAAIARRLPWIAGLIPGSSPGTVMTVEVEVEVEVQTVFRLQSSCPDLIRASILYAARIHISVS